MLNIFIDIDGTITDDMAHPQISSEHLLGNALFDVILEALVDSGLDAHAAKESIIKYAQENTFWDYKDFILEFKLPPSRTWTTMEEWHGKNIRVYDDAVAMIHSLHGMGHKLYIMSNNPRTGCLMKLQRAGLGDISRSPWFSEILCSNICRGQKGSVDFWRRALEYSACKTESVVMIGDSMQDDYTTPSQAGISKYFIVNRRQRDHTLRVHDATFVNSLALVPDLIGRLALKATACQ